MTAFEMHGNLKTSILARGVMNSNVNHPRHALLLNLQVLPSRRRARQSHGRAVVGNRPRRPSTLFNTLRAPGYATTYTDPNNDSDSDGISSSVRGDHEDYDGGSNSDPPRRGLRGRRMPSPASIDDVSRRDQPSTEIDDDVREHRRRRRPSQQQQQKPQQQQRYRHIYHHAGALPKGSSYSAVDGGRDIGGGHERRVSEAEEPTLEQSRRKPFVPTVTGTGRAGADDTPGRLAARLADLEVRLSSEGYMEAGDDVGKRTSYNELGAVSGRSGDAGGAMSVAECDVQVCVCVSLFHLTALSGPVGVISLKFSHFLPRMINDVCHTNSARSRGCVRFPTLRAIIIVPSPPPSTQKAGPNHFGGGVKDRQFERYVTVVVPLTTFLPLLSCLRI